MNSNAVFLLKILLITSTRHIFKLLIALFQPLAEWLHKSLLKLKGISELQIALAATGRSILQAILI